MDGWMDGWMDGCMYVCIDMIMHLFITMYRQMVENKKGEDTTKKGRGRGRFCQAIITLLGLT